MAANATTSRRTKIVVGVFVMAILAFVLYLVFGTVLLWQGGYTLKVHFDVSGEQPKKVECALVDRIEYANSVRESLGKPSTRPFFDSYSSSAYIDPFLGEHIELYNRTGGRENAFGVETNWYQSKYLFVVAHWPDGRQTLTVADVPDGRKSKEMIVSLP